VLDQGRTLAAGTPEEIRRDPKVATAYLGRVEAAADGDGG
jgi:ABC-type branched-subunit amino acid transport system ATPase component